jgi:hypothetical protein
MIFYSVIVNKYKDIIDIVFNDIYSYPKTFKVPYKYRYLITFRYINYVHKKLKEAHEWSEEELKSLREF